MSVRSKRECVLGVDPIGDVNERAYDAAPNMWRLRRTRKYEGKHHSNSYQRPERGEQPQRPSQIKMAKVDRTGSSLFVDEQGRDEESGEYEEDVDSQKAARDQETVV